MPVREQVGRGLMDVTRQSWRRGSSGRARKCSRSSKSSSIGDCSCASVRGAQHERGVASSGSAFRSKSCRRPGSSVPVSCRPVASSPVAPCGSFTGSASTGRDPSKGGAASSALGGAAPRLPISRPSRRRAGRRRRPRASIGSSAVSVRRLECRSPITSWVPGRRRWQARPPRSEGGCRRSRTGAASAGSEAAGCGDARVLAARGAGFVEGITPGLVGGLPRSGSAASMTMVVVGGASCRGHAARLRSRRPRGSRRARRRPRWGRPLRSVRARPRAAARAGAPAAARRAFTVVHEGLGLEGLGDVTVGADRLGAAPRRRLSKVPVSRSTGTCRPSSGSALIASTHLVAVLAGHDDVGQHDVGSHVLRAPWRSAPSPLSTVTRTTSSLAKLIPTTFWMVTLSSARSRVFDMIPPKAIHGWPQSAASAAADPPVASSACVSSRGLPGH